MAMTVRENVILMLVMAIIIIGVAWVRGLESAAVQKVEGFRGRGERGRRGGGSGVSLNDRRSGYGGRRGGGWFGGSSFLPYWFLSRGVGSALSPSTMNVTNDDPYLTGVSRVTATIQLILTAGLVGTGIYLAYKWLVVKRR